MEYDQNLITRISFELTLWKCNTCHKIFRTEQGCANHEIKEIRQQKEQKRY